MNSARSAWRAHGTDDNKPAQNRQEQPNKSEDFTKGGIRMKKLTRRTVLKTGTALGGGMAAILATGRAPAFAQGSTVHWLRWNDFVPASDQLLRKEILPEGEKALGIKINFETVNGNDLQPRITSAIQSGSGPDLIMLNNNHPQLYAASCVDMTDVVEPLAKAEGAQYPLVKANSNDGKKWLSMPWAIIGAMIAYRKSWFEDVGSPQFPDTVGKYREAGKQLKTDVLHSPLPKGPAGQFSMHTYHSHVLPTYSKNQKAAKDFLRWIHSRPVYEKWFVSQKGFATPCTPEWEKHKVWTEDP